MHDQSYGTLVGDKNRHPNQDPVTGQTPKGKGKGKRQSGQLLAMICSH